MPQVPMYYAIPGTVASALDNNRIIDNVIDHETRVVTLESRTLDGTSGNTALSNRLGTGVGSTTNETTGTASAQFTGVRTRLTTLESRTTNATYGNTALDTRLGTGVTSTSDPNNGTATAQFTSVRARLTTLEGATGATTAYGRAVDTTTNQNILSSGSVFYGVTFNTLIQTAGLTYSASTNTFTVNAGFGGLYQISAGAAFSANSNGGRGMQIWVNNTPISGGGYQYSPNSAATYAIVAKSKLHRLNDGDTVRLAVWQSSGGTLALRHETDIQPFLDLIRVAG